MAKSVSSSEIIVGLIMEKQRRFIRPLSLGRIVQPVIDVRKARHVIGLTNNVVNSLVKYERLLKALSSVRNIIHSEIDVAEPFQAISLTQAIVVLLMKR